MVQRTYVTAKVHVAREFYPQSLEVGTAVFWGHTYDRTCGVVTDNDVFVNVLVFQSTAILFAERLARIL